MSRPVLEGLEAALARAGTHSLDDLQRQLEEGSAQWWSGRDSAIVTELISYPLRPCLLRYWLVAGRLEECLGMQPDIEAWAKGEGASHAVAEGRKGWARILPAHGWRQRSISYVKEL